MTKTVIKTDSGLINRTITVDNDGGVFLKVSDNTGKEIQTNLTAWESKALPMLINALLGEGATVIKDLPEAGVDNSFSHTNTVIRSGSRIAYTVANPAKLVTEAKELLALAAFITKHNEAEAAAEEATVKAKEAANTARRDELVKELSGNSSTEYQYATPLTQAAIDRIITLEEAAK